MVSLNKVEKTSLYYVLLAVLIPAIIGTFIVIDALKTQEEPFSTLGFTDPKQIPSHARTSQEYTIAYTVNNFEHEKTQYELTNKLSLYRLYDVTEGLHSCLNPFIRRIYLSWGNASIPKDVHSQEETISFHAPPDPVNLIPWGYYKASIGFEKEKLDPLFIIYFKDENDNTKYVVKVDTKTGSVFIDDEFVGNASIRPRHNNVLIAYKDDLLKVNVNTEFSAEKTVKGAQKGQFGFASVRGYLKPSVLVYKDKAKEVPYKGNSWKYELDFSNYYKSLSDRRKGESLRITLARDYTQENFAQECANEFACNYLKKDEKIYIFNNKNIEEVIQTTYFEKQRNTFSLRPTENKQMNIPWSEFTLETNYDKLEYGANIAFWFENELGILITKDSYAILETDGTKTSIHTHPLTQSEENLQPLRLVVNNSKLTVELQNTSQTITFRKDLTNKNMSVAHIKTFKSVRDIVVRKIHEDCNEGFKDFCQVYYEVRRPKTTITIKEDDEPKQIAKENEEQRENFLGQVKELFEIEENRVEEGQRDNPLITQQAYETQVINYNGESAAIINQTNVTFGFAYYFLDGQGLVQLVFNDLNGNPLLSATSSVNEQKTVFTYPENGELKNIEIPVLTLEDDWNRLRLFIGDDIIELQQNRTVLARINNANINSGYFSITTIDTYAELKDAFIKNATVSRTLPITLSACQLNLVYEETLRDTSFILDTQESKTIEQTFNIEKEFDYAQFTVDLEGSSSTDKPLHIHAWMVRE